jgi:hypothetical protein
MAYTYDRTAIIVQTLCFRALSFYYFGLLVGPIVQYRLPILLCTNISNCIVELRNYNIYALRFVNNFSN